MKKIKVALIYSSNGFGGMITNLAKIINFLNREQFEVILISLENNNSIVSLINPRLPTKVIELDCRERIDLKTIFKIRKILIAEDVRLLSLHGYKANFYGLISSFQLNLKRVTTIHGWVSQSLKLKFYQYLDQFLILFFDKIILVSPAQVIRHPYLKIFHSKISVIENAIDPLEMKITDEQKLAKDKDVLILGTASRLAPEKKVDLLITACSKLKEQNWRLLILGDGKELANLICLRDSLGLQDKIVFLGFQKDVKPYLHHFDIFLSASSIEGMPNSLLEAGACETAVIVSDIPEHTVVVKDQIQGLLFPLDNAMICAEQISLLLTNQELRERLAKEFKLHLITNYSLDRRAKLFNDLFIKTAGV